MLYILFSLIILFPVFAGFGSLIEYFIGKFTDGISSKLLLGILTISILFVGISFIFPLNLYLEIPTILIGFNHFSFLSYLYLFHISFQIFCILSYTLSSNWRSFLISSTIILSSLIASIRWRVGWAWASVPSFVASRRQRERHRRAGWSMSVCWEQKITWKAVGWASTASLNRPVLDRRRRCATTFVSNLPFRRPSTASNFRVQVLPAEGSPQNNTDTDAPLPEGEGWDEGAHTRNGKKKPPLSGGKCLHG